MLKSFAFHIICKCISKLHRRAAKNTRMTTFQLFKLSSPFQETFCNVEKCPKKSHFFHKKKKKKIEFFRKIYKSNFSAKIQCVIFRNRNFFPCKKSTVAISARKFKYLISNFPQKSTVAVLANSNA